MTSPPARVPNACHVRSLIVCLRYRTDPSANAILTPPGWLLRKAHWPRTATLAKHLGSSQSVGIPNPEPHDPPKTALITAPVLSGGALIRGRVNAPVWGRRSPGQVEPREAAPKTSVRYQRLKGVGSSFRNRDISPQSAVLLVPSVTSATLMTPSAPNIPLPSAALHFDAFWLALSG